MSRKHLIGIVVLFLAVVGAEAAVVDIHGIGSNEYGDELNAWARFETTEGSDVLTVTLINTSRLDAWYPTDILTGPSFM